MKAPPQIKRFWTKCSRRKETHEMYKSSQDFHEDWPVQGVTAGLEKVNSCNLICKSTCVAQNVRQQITKLVLTNWV